MDMDCYQGRGEDYNGTMSTASTNQPCLVWNMTSNGGWSHNYCRNPNGTMEGPWCYVNASTPERCHLDLHMCDEIGSGNRGMYVRLPVDPPGFALVIPRAIS